MKSPEEIVALMMQHDEFSKWLGIEILTIKKGYCQLTISPKLEMLNGFKILHGGISYAISDSAMAFAANAYGYQCVSIETNISHIRPVHPTDKLIATVKEMHRGKSIGIYEVVVTNQENKAISLFKGTMHISEKIW